MENPQRLNVQSHPGNLEAQWVVGFVDGEGCFFVGIIVDLAARSFVILVADFNSN